LASRVNTDYCLHMEAIRVNGLTKRYGTTLAVDDISFAVAPGATLGLLGGNGAGKTTTIAMLLGILIPSAGSIHILGHDMATACMGTYTTSANWSRASTSWQASSTSASSCIAPPASCLPARRPAWPWPRR
jgi:ABC-type uncharacterized transport system ATPase subunit